MFCDADLEGGILLGAPITDEVEVDYLCLGYCYDPALHERVKSFALGSSLQLGRLWLSKKTLYFDGKQVATMKWSTSNSTKFGKKMLLDCSGSWFRAGLSASDAVCFLRHLESALAEGGILGEGVPPGPWITYISIERIDYVLECLAPELDPEELRQRELAHGWRLKEGRWSEDGTSLYGGAVRVPTSKRGSQPFINVYAWADPERPELGPTVRAEVRVPRVRTTSGEGSLVGAALLARDQIEAATGHKVQVVLAGEHPVEGEGVPLRVLDFEGRWAPDHIWNQPYQGHGTAFLRRMARQGVTILERTCASAVFSALLPQAAGHQRAPAQTFDGEPLPEAELVASGELDARGELVPLALQPPMTLEELDHLEEVLAEYRRTFYPGTQPVAVREALPVTRHHARCEAVAMYAQRLSEHVAEAAHPEGDDFIRSIERGRVYGELRPLVADALDEARRDLEREREALGLADALATAELIEAQREADEAQQWARSARAWRASCEAKLKRTQLRRNRLLQTSGPARRVYERVTADELDEAAAAVSEAAGEVIRIEELEHLANEALARAQARAFDRFLVIEQGVRWVDRLRVPQVLRIRSRIDEAVEADWAYRRDTWVEQYRAYRAGARRTLPAWANEAG